ncbi:MAG: glycosyltransferase, partial [Mycobacteriales bacterium]
MRCTSRTASCSTRCTSRTRSTWSPVAEPRATVIVLNYNGERLIGDCLRALAAQDVAAGDAETWVVDNASRDTSADLVAREFPDV